VIYIRHSERVNNPHKILLKKRILPTKKTIVCLTRLR